MNTHFIIDPEKDNLDCVFGEYYETDDIVLINCALIDSIYSLISTILHEELHRTISNTGQITNEKQDHWVIPRMLL